MIKYQIEPPADEQFIGVQERDGVILCHRITREEGDMFGAYFGNIWIGYVELSKYDGFLVIV